MKKIIIEFKRLMFSHIHANNFLSISTKLQLDVWNRDDLNYNALSRLVIICILFLS